MNIRTIVIATGTLALLTVAGCATTQAGAGAPSAGAPAAGAPAAGNTTVAAPPANPAAGNQTNLTNASAGHSGGGGTPECKANTLKLGFGPSSTEMNQVHQQLLFTNTGSRPCVIVGFPGVSFVAGDNGQQVGAPAQRDGKIGAQVTLAPGQTAHAPVDFANTGVFDQGACKPTPVRGYRVYAPDDTAAMFIPLNLDGMYSTACAGTVPVAELSVQTIVAGVAPAN